MESYFKINRRLIEYLNFESLRNFLRPIPSIQSSGLKADLIARIEEAINNNVLPKETFAEFLSHELRYGHNRVLFITRINSATLHKIKDFSRLKEALKTAGLPNEEFSNYIDFVPHSDKPELVHLEINRVGAAVQQIVLCFANMVLVNRTTGEMTSSLEDTDYAWVTIDIINEQLIVALRPRSNFSNETSAKSVATFDHYTNYLSRIFSLKYFSNDEMKSILYNIFKEMTTKAERPYVEKVRPLESEITRFCNEVAASIGLPSCEKPVNLPFRVRRLLERALIQEDFFNFKAYSIGKVGTVERFLYADETGARVNATTDDSEGIGLKDIYFDTRDTIDDQKTFNKLWIQWFYDSDPQNNISTKLEVTSKYYIIHFYKYHTGDEQKHVLSAIETFK